MQETLTTVIGRQHPPQPAAVRVLDRLALHLGVALITWSRRPRAHETHANARERDTRERAASRMLHLRVPQR